MAADRVAQRRSRTHQVLALDAPGREETQGLGPHGKAPLDHRAGLRRTEARTWIGSLRRKRLARFSSSRYPLYCGLWVPGGRTEPFFPLCSCRSTGTIHLRNAAPVPPSGIAGFASSGIIPGRLPRSAEPSPGFFFDNSPVVLFVELHTYNTVVLGSPVARPTPARALQPAERQTV